MTNEEIILRINAIQDELERLKQDISGAQKAPVRNIEEIKEFSFAESFVMFLAANGKL